MVTRDNESHHRASMNQGIQEESADPGGPIDRRENSRFPVTENVKYTVIHSRSLRTTGSGKTLNFGSGGLLFTTEDRLPVGRTVELSVTWPALLGGKCPLQFVARGR